jgi:hypothetical protein
MRINDIGIYLLFVMMSSQKLSVDQMPPRSVILFELLGIPHEVAMSIERSRYGRIAAFKLLVTWDNLPALARWAPASAKKAEETRVKILEYIKHNDHQQGYLTQVDLT